MSHRFNKPIGCILLLAFLARVAVVLLYADFGNDYYWEYGEIANNLLDGKGYSYFVENNLRPQPRIPDANPSPSAYVPPGYVAWLVPFLLVDDAPLRNALLLLSQVLISTASIWFLYLLARRHFSDRVALLAALTAAVLPEFLYASLSFTPTVLYHLFVPILFLRLDDLESSGGRYTAWRIGLLLGLLIYLRSEFVLFAVLVLLFFLLQRRIRAGIVAGAVMLTLLLPWSIRNYVVFDAVVPMTTSFGLNLYRGHNPYYIGAWGDERLENELRSMERERFEIEMSRAYRDRAFGFMAENPEREGANALLKLVRFWSFDPYYEPSMQPLYYVPNVLLFLLWAFGVAAGFSWRKYRHYYLFFLSSIAIVIAFFPLPRYQTMMKILALPFAAYGAVRLYEIVRERLARRKSPGSERKG